MLDEANVDKNCNTTAKRRRVYETLTKEQQLLLRQLTIGHGNMAVCEDYTGKHREMILRAMQGGRLLPQNAKKIREFIKAHV